VRLPQFVFRLGLEAALWLCLPAAFLLVYVNRHFAPREAVLPHLRLVMLALLALALVRILLAVSIKSDKASRLAAALLVAGLLAGMAGYYALVLIGLQSWGRVITWDLMSSYSTQVLVLADAIGLHAPSVLGALVLAGVALFAAAWLYLRHLDWTDYVARCSSGALIVLLLLSGWAVCAIELYNFTSAPPTRHAEPLSITFYPMAAGHNLQGYAVDALSAKALDASEDAERAAYQASAAPARRNLVLIVVDALRPDHMGIYGYRRDTTPALSRLERSGMTRKTGAMRAICASSACGLLGMMSSKFVHQFSNRPFTLQEALKRHGYAIHLLLSGDHTSFYGMKLIYGAADSYFDGHGVRRFKHMNDDQLVLERLAAFPDWDGSPVMLHFHLMSAHVLGRRDRALPKYQPSGSYAQPANRGSDHASEERVVNFYDNGVVQTDATIELLLAALERKGYLRNTVVAITADHGESLGEHGLYQHANSVREEVLRVPFLLVAYGYRPAEPIDGGRRLASQVDIAPTLLAELGLPSPRTWAGTPLQESLGREFTYFQELAEVGLFDHRDPANLWKYWVHSRSGQEYAFNLSLDPQERRNLIDTAPLQLKREWRLRVLPGASVHTSADVRHSVAPSLLD
jgi:glucan phosphoethanolaminetransferase (alkaline phosphatase superfamily)